MNRSLLDRLDRLEQHTAERSDLEGATYSQLMAYLTEVLGHVPTDEDLERLAAKASKDEQVP